MRQVGPLGGARVVIAEREVLGGYLEREAGVGLPSQAPCWTDTRQSAGDRRAVLENEGSFGTDRDAKTRQRFPGKARVAEYLGVHTVEPAVYELAAQVKGGRRGRHKLTADMVASPVTIARVRERTSAEHSHPCAVPRADPCGEARASVHHVEELASRNSVRRCANAEEVHAGCSSPFKPIGGQYRHAVLGRQSAVGPRRQYRLAQVIERLSPFELSLRLAGFERKPCIVMDERFAPAPAVVIAFGCSLGLDSRHVGRRGHQTCVSRECRACGASPPVDACLLAAGGQVTWREHEVMVVGRHRLSITADAGQQLRLQFPSLGQRGLCLHEGVDLRHRSRVLPQRG